MTVNWSFTDPTKVVLTFLAGHMITSTIFRNWDTAFRAGSGEYKFKNYCKYLTLLLGEPS
jgi:hypothetical protein